MILAARERDAGNLDGLDVLVTPPLVGPLGGVGAQAKTAGIAQD